MGVPGVGRKVRVNHPELDAVAGPMKADQIGAHRTAPVEAELADSLGELGDKEVIPIELAGASDR